MRAAFGKRVPSSRVPNLAGDRDHRCFVVLKGKNFIVRRCENKLGSLRDPSSILLFLFSLAACQSLENGIQNLGQSTLWKERNNGIVPRQV